MASGKKELAPTFEYVRDLVSDGLGTPAHLFVPLVRTASRFVPVIPGVEGLVKLRSKRQNLLVVDRQAATDPPHENLKLQGTDG